MIFFKKLTRIVKKKDNELFAIRVRPDMKDIFVSDEFKGIVSEYKYIYSLRTCQILYLPDANWNPKLV